MGTCNGVLSSCALGGYAMESRYVFLLTFSLLMSSFMHHVVAIWETLSSTIL